jgi:hypothetical protein
MYKIVINWSDDSQSIFTNADKDLARMVFEHCSVNGFSSTPNIPYVVTFQLEPQEV